MTKLAILSKAKHLKYSIKCDTIKGMSHMSAIFNFEFSTSITCPFKMLHFDPNPISIGHLVVEI